MSGLEDGLHSTNEKALLRKLTNPAIKTLLRVSPQHVLVDRVLRGAANTDDRGLALVHYAVECFESHCRVSNESPPLIVIQKVDRGSNKSFSRLPEVQDQRLCNVFKFNESGHLEKPDGAYRVKVVFGGTTYARGLVVEIDGDNGKKAQPRQTATKMWEHIMYSKLAAGGGVSSIQTNGFTLRMNLARAEIKEDEDELERYNDYVRGTSKWSKKNSEFWQMKCVRVLGSLAGSVIFCLRDMVLSMMKLDTLADENWMYNTYKNSYHVNMFVGPFDLKLQDNTVNIKDVNASAEKYCTKKGAQDKRKYRKVQWIEDVEWYVDFKYMSRGTCGQTNVQYLLIENFQGAVSDGKYINGTNHLPCSPQDFRQRKNRGLMTLVDILNCRALINFHFGNVPNWKLRDYVGKQNQTRAGAFQSFFERLNAWCGTMENFILFQIHDAIEWPVIKTWPMREWMDEIAHSINSRIDKRQIHVRSEMTMTVDKYEHNPNSLMRRLKKSLHETLPALDETVVEYLHREGFDNIRDATLYLRLIGVTNILALEQLANTHAILLDTDKFHARTFNALALGTQSEMQLMFERITLNPRMPVELLDILDFEYWDDRLTDNVKSTYVSAARKCMLDYFTDMKVQPRLHQKQIDIRNFMLKNANFFFTHAVYALARVDVSKQIECPKLKSGRDISQGVKQLDFWNSVTRRMRAYNLEDKDSRKIDVIFRDMEKQEESCELYLFVYDTDTAFDFKNQENEETKSVLYEIFLGHTRLKQFMYIVLRCIENTNNTVRMLIDLIHEHMLEGDDFFANIHTNAYFMMTCIFSDAYKPMNISEDIDYSTHALDICNLCEVSKIAQLQLTEDLKVFEAATEHIFDSQFLRNGHAHVIIKQYIDFKNKGLRYAMSDVEVEAEISENDSDEQSSPSGVSDDE